MADLSKYRKNVVSLIDAPVHANDLRPYLGMSGIGHSCSRYLWYSFRWAYRDEITARVKRLFNRGHREEAVVIKELTNIGCVVSELQREFVSGFGHVKGHWDGKIEHVPDAPAKPHVLEIKTMNDKYFKHLLKYGVKHSKPVYYAQMQLYMGHSGLDRALFVSVNKNDDSMYAERVSLDKNELFILNSRAASVVMAETPLPRPFSPTWFECKWCAAREMCHGTEPMHVSCRTCTKAEPTNKGKWECNGTVRTDQEQLEACSKYEAICNV